jgi:hypothetical protein
MSSFSYLLLLKVRLLGTRRQSGTVPGTVPAGFGRGRGRSVAPPSPSPICPESPGDSPPSPSPIWRGRDSERSPVPDSHRGVRALVERAAAAAAARARHIICPVPVLESGISLVHCRWPVAATECQWHVPHACARIALNEGGPWSRSAADDESALVSARLRD